MNCKNNRCSSGPYLLNISIKNFTARLKMEMIKVEFKNNDVIKRIDTQILVYIIGSSELLSSSLGL